MLKGVLSIQSQVIYGHVGNSAAQMALQRLGFECFAVPTVLFSNHPGHGSFTGERLGAENVQSLIDGVKKLGAFPDLKGVLSGYLGAPDHAGIVRQAVDAVRSERQGAPVALYCCDPVIGDAHSGAYVADGIAERIKQDLVPIADILTPNSFELSYLSGIEVTNPESAVTAARKLSRPLIVCTSVPVSADRIGTVAITPSAAWLASTPVVEDPPHGVGDLFAAVFLGHMLYERPVQDALRRSVMSVDSLIRLSEGHPAKELLMVRGRELVENPRSAGLVRLSRLG